MLPLLRCGNQHKHQRVVPKRNDVNFKIDLGSKIKPPSEQQEQANIEFPYFEEDMKESKNYIQANMDALK